MSEQNTKQSEWKNREIGALWKRKSDSGKTYCSGHFIVDELGNEVKVKVVMFSNTEKKNEKSPDFLIYLSKDQKSKLSPENPSAVMNSVLAAPAATNVGGGFEDDGIPM